LIRGRDREVFSRWAPAVARVLGQAASVPAVAAAWQRGQRATAARLLVSAVRENLLGGGVRGGALVLDGDAEGLPLWRTGALALPVPELSTPRPPWLEDPLALWERMAASLELDAAVSGRVADELADSAFNLALASLAAQARPAWARAHPDDPRTTDPEHWVTDGHPWHPMTKTRLGLGLAEHARLAPELLARTPLGAVDVRASLAQVEPALVERLAPWLGRAAPGWVRLPVHGRQLPRLARSPSARMGRDVVPVPWHASGRSLLSLRTAAFEDPAVGPLHLKLALGVHTTSARRVVSPMSVYNGPRVSALLAAIQAADPECAGIAIAAETLTGGLAAHVDGAAELGVIVRDGRAFLGPNGAPAWVCAGLGEPSPLDGYTGVVRLTEGFEGSPPQRARAMLEQYLARLVPPLLRFCVAHGVALEGHLQNTLVHAVDGRPAGFVVRDLGGIRLHGPRLAARGHRVALHPASFIVTDDLAEVRSKLAHTLFHAHLGTLFTWVEDALGLPGAEAWALARRCVCECLRRWSADPSLRPACEADLASWLAPRVRAKALLRMRIEDASSEYAYAEVDNPLADRCISPTDRRSSTGA
jgi:siderophore synthetase component